MSNQEWENIWEGLSELREWFGEGVILIGGLAVWLHGKNQGDQAFLELSHDADFLLSLQDYADLRDLEEVTRNRRRTKHQIIKNGIDFDIYVESQNDLSVPYAEAACHAKTIDGYSVLSLEHLLVLKCDAALSRRGAKRDKDLRDIQRIVILMRQPDLSILSRWMTEDRMNVVREAAGRMDLFNELAEGNSHKAAILKRQFDQVYRVLEESCAQDDFTPEP